jgi:hypothetical protein
MNVCKTVITSLLLIFVGVWHLPNAHATENATIVNKSTKNVEFYLKWSDLPQESEKIVLEPDESRPAKGVDGTVLKMRYNSTPGQLPPREKVVKVITANVNNPHHSASFWFHKLLS